MLVAARALLPGEAHPQHDLFPEGRLDQDLQQVDLRDRNSWRLMLAEVPTVELLEMQLVNAVAPFVLNARLKPLMLRTPGREKHVVNVSAVEGQFYRRFKTTKHPHTNMAKAALNMMTRTSAAEYHADGIHMNSVDTGWVTDEDPVDIAERKTAEHRFHPPLDIVDGAARILDPIIDGVQHRHPRVRAVPQGLPPDRLVTSRSGGAAAGTMRPVSVAEPSDDQARYRAPVGTHDVLPPESARWTALVAAFAERAGRFGFGLVLTPIFEHLEVFQRVGESTDVVRKEMYDFEDKGGRRIALRPEGTASVVRGVRAAPPARAVEGLVRRPALPLRAPAEGPLPPALAGRRRGARRRRPRARRRGHRARARLLPRRSGCATSRCCINSMGDERRPRRVRRGAPRVPARPRGAELGDGFRERVEANPLRVLDSKDPRLAGRHRARAAAHRAPERRTRATHFEAVQHGLDALGIALRDRPAARPRLRLLHEHHVRVPERRARRGAERASAAAAATTGSPRRWAARPRRASASGSAIERVLIACDAEGDRAGRATPRPTCSSSTGSTPTAAEVTLAASPSCARTACGPSAPTATAR